MLGPLFIDVEGLELTDEDREILQHPLVGGVIYFSRNYESREQITQLTQEIKLLRSPELLIAVDHEGGRVQRFRHDFTMLPPVNSIGRVYDDNQANGLEYAYQHGWLMAAELRVTGIDFSFSPVLDLDYGHSTVIGDRALHQSPDAVANLAQYYINGMQAAGMKATGKHFPGHGWAVEDSHTAIPRDERSFSEIIQQDVVPYRRLLEYGLASVMPAHVIYTEVDPMPACFSHKWLQEILRQQIGFHGLVISDDLTMQGASIVEASVAGRAALALEAGCDMALICNNRQATIETLEQLQYTTPIESRERIELLRGKQMKGLMNLQNQPVWKHAVHIMAHYNNVMV